MCSIIDWPIKCHVKTIQKIANSTPGVIIVAESAVHQAEGTSIFDIKFQILGWFKASVSLIMGTYGKETKGIIIRRPYKETSKILSSYISQVKCRRLFKVQDS